MQTPLLGSTSIFIDSIALQVSLFISIFFICDTFSLIDCPFYIDEIDIITSTSVSNNPS